MDLAFCLGTKPMTSSLTIIKKPLKLNFRDTTNLNFIIVFACPDTLLTGF